MRSVDCCAQSAAKEAVPTRPSCVYQGPNCMPTTHRGNADGCAALACDACASNMCPTSGNENEYHWCPRHCVLSAKADGESEECESDEDLFAYKPTGRSATR